VLSTVIAARASAAAGSTVCHLADGRITEASGLVASDRQDDVLFTHNDSGDSARFFAIGTDCSTRATYVLPDVTATDWEDIARGPGPDGGTVLWLGDIGDNDAQRANIVVHQVAEPRVPAAAAAPPTIDVRSTAFSLRYPDGAHDAEALLADPRDGRLYVVTKTYGGHCAVYAAPLPLVGAATLVKVAELDIPPSTGGTSFASLAGSRAVTGGDIAPDGSRVVLRTYTAAFEAAIPATAGSPRLQAAYASGLPGTLIDLPPEEQGEAIAYARDGRSMWLTSEKSHPPLDHVVLPPATTPTTSPKPAVLQVPDEADPHVYRYGGIALAVAAVLVFGWGRLRRRHRSRG
jgi:hypothetical protein